MSFPRPEKKISIQLEHHHWFVRLNDSEVLATCLVRDLLYSVPRASFVCRYIALTFYVLVRYLHSIQCIARWLYISHLLTFRGDIGNVHIYGLKYVRL